MIQHFVLSKFDYLLLFPQVNEGKCSVNLLLSHVVVFGGSLWEGLREQKFIHLRYFFAPFLEIRY